MRNGYYKCALLHHGITKRGIAYISTTQSDDLKIQEFICDKFDE